MADFYMLQSHMKQQWYRSRSVNVSYHVLAWLLLFSLPVLFHREENSQKINWSHLYAAKSVVINSCWIAFFYLNANLLVPRLFSRKKAGIYLLTLIGLFGLFILLISLIFPDPKKGFRTEILFTIFPFLFIWAMSTVYRIVTDKVHTDQLFKERENENLKTELSFLRSQVSPHFLFNVLNNMVAMARLKSDLLEPSLIRLSGLMRYMLYESDEDKVPLAKELDYVASYIELQKLRFARPVDIRMKADEPQQQAIEPMLLIPFIENAFKHGTGLVTEPVIDISLTLSGDELFFHVKNKFSPEALQAKDKTAGIGLANVVRRLNLLYANRHEIRIGKQDGWFTVYLHLKLST